MNRFSFVLRTAVADGNIKIIESFLNNNFELEKVRNFISEEKFEELKLLQKISILKENLNTKLKNKNENNKKLKL